MRIYLNGSPVELREGASVRDAAATAGVEPESRGIAVAVDGEVVPAAELGRRPLSEGQRVEVVKAIQGGA